MLTSNQIGNLGVAKAISDFISHGFDVFTEFSGNNPFDFVAHRQGLLWKVEVRTTTKKSTHNSFPIGLRGSAYGPDRSIVHKPLRNIDILVGYLQPIDTLVYLNFNEIDAVGTIYFRNDAWSKLVTSHQRIISNYTDLEKALGDR